MMMIRYWSDSEIAPTPLRIIFTWDSFSRQLINESSMLKQNRSTSPFDDDVQFKVTCAAGHTTAGKFVRYQIFWCGMRALFTIAGGQCSGCLFVRFSRASLIAFNCWLHGIITCSRSVTFSPRITPVRLTCFFSCWLRSLNMAFIARPQLVPKVPMISPTKVPFDNSRAK